MNAHFVTFFLFVSLLFKWKIVESTDDSRSKSDRKLNRIWKRGAPYAAPLHSGNYTSNAITPPRDFPLAIFFTARAPKYNCFACTMFEEQFQEVAEAYMKLPKEKRTGTNQMAFVTADVDSCQNAFQMNQFNQIPRLFILPPMPEGTSMKGPFTLDWEINMGQYSNEGFVAYLKQKYGIKIPGMAKDESWLLVVGGLLAIVWAVFGHFVCKDRQKAKFFFWNRTLWYFISLACYAFGVSGMVYCIIRNPPTHLARGKDMMEMISGESRGQYVYEGLLIGFSNIISGLSLVALYMTCKARPSRWMMLPRLLMSSFFLALFIYSLQFTYILYVTKTRWYATSRTLPEQAQQWLDASVKKSSGWAKRIIRMSQYFLFEFKSLKALQKKVDVLIFGYAYRFPGIALTTVQETVTTLFWFLGDIIQKFQSVFS